MNQILSNNDYNNNYNKMDTKKIIVIFCIAIILIAIIIASVAFSNYYKKKKQQANYPTPQIEIVKDEEDETKVAIKVEATDGLNYIIYTWDDGKENRVNNLNASKTFERIIDIPQNATNNLKVQAVSINGIMGEKTETFELDIDTDKPKIDSITIVNSKLRVEVSDETGIDYLAYKWENEEEQIVKADENNNQTFSTELEIKRGTYELQLRVVDINGNEEKISKLITGVKEPEIDVTRYDNVVNIIVSHDMGFKRVEFLINDDLYIYDENLSGYSEDTKELNFDFPLKEGENIVRVKAYSLEKLSSEGNDSLDNYAAKTFSGKCTYEPQQ